MAAARLPHKPTAPLVTPLTIHCKCGKASIAAPPGATAQTTYTCRECCAKAMARQAKKQNNGVYYIGGPLLDSGLKELVGC